MKLKNIGTKIINVGEKVLMPDAEMEITELQAKAPAIQVLIKHKMLELTAETKEVAQKEEAKAETKAEEKATEEKVEEKAAEVKEETKEVAQKEAKKATKKAE